MRRRAQTAIEFIVLLGFMLFVFTAFFYVIKERSTFIAVQSRHTELQTVSDIIFQEVASASRVRDGYARTFEIPAMLTSGTYTVTLTSNTEVSMATQDEEYLLFLPTNVSFDSNDGAGPQATAVLPTGKIRITKTNGRIIMYAG